MLRCLSPSLQRTCLLLSLSAAGLLSSFPPRATAGDLYAGAAKVDITPPSGVSLDGPISKNGVVTAVNDPLHARAIVLADGPTRLAIVVCDLCMVEREVFDQAKRIAAQRTQLAAHQMLFSATHTHAAPRAIHIGTGPLDDQYHAWLPAKIAEAVIAAEANLAPAQVAFASFDRGELLACRRLLCEPGSVGPNPFGQGGERIKSVAGRSDRVIEPAGPVDPQFSILSLQHRDGAPLALLGNFSVHYCGGYEPGVVSADYFGHYAAAIEARLTAGDDHPPVVGMMSNGTSGNAGSFQRVAGEPTRRYAPYERMKVIGRMLAEETVTALRNATHRSDVSLDVRQTELELAVRRPDAARLAWAEAVLADPDGLHPHRWSKIYAQEAQHLADYPDRVRLLLQAFRIGPVGIAAVPCEVFAETGLAIKADSPWPHTFTIELANGYGGYLPPPEQHRLGGYETWPARSSFLEIDAEPKIRQVVLKMLDDLHQSSDTPAAAVSK